MKLAYLALAAALLGQTAIAAPVSTDEAEGVIVDYGAEFESDWVESGGATKVDIRMNDINATVRLGNCGDDGRCGYVMMFATFDLGVPADKEVFDKTNFYNDSYPFGRAFILDNEDEAASDIVGIDYTVDLSNEANFDTDDLETFKSVLDAYVAHWSKQEE